MMKELGNKLENENMDRCKVCLKFKTCKITNKKEIVDCEEFEEAEDFVN